MARVAQKPEEPSDDNSNEQGASAPNQQIGAANFWNASSFAELAAAQGVRPVGKLEEIMGGDRKIN